MSDIILIVRPNARLNSSTKGSLVTGDSLASLGINVKWHHFQGIYTVRGVTREANKMKQ